MATNKNQHYVPQCYLRKFSPDENEASINLLNIDRKRFVKSAPIKSQCSKNYFYGKDLKLEKALQPLEGKYSALVKEISSPRYKLSNQDGIFLKQFWLLQYMRTEAASRRSVQMQEEMGVVSGIPPEEYRIELKEAVYNSMKGFVDHREIADDLGVCLIRNKTNIEFITSDDPAVLTNKWFLRNDKQQKVSFGIGSSGCILLLPLTPEILFIGYDKNIYRLSKKNGWVEVGATKDVHAFNEHQFLNCRANIFTHNENSEYALLEQFSNIEGNRPKQRHKINYSVLDSNIDGYERYRVVDFSEAGKHEKALMHCQMVSPVPSTWPSQICKRHRAFVYTNGSAVGYVRKSQVMPNEGYNKKFI